MDRNSFKATKVSDLKKLKEKDDKIAGSGGRTNTDFITIENGSNKIRIAPKFPTEEDFYHIRTVTWVNVEKEDGNIGRLPVLNSKVHGGTKFDIIEEYVKFVKESLDSNNASDKKKLEVLTDWKVGLKPSTSWWAYGWKLATNEDPKFGIFELNYSLRDQLNSLAIIEDPDEAIETDPFTDVESGIPVLVKYNKEEKDNKKKYNMQLAKREYPLTDEMFEELISKKPISELLQNVYTLKDFEKALEGIRNFDIENEIELFDSSEFEEIIITVRAQYSSEDKDKKDSKKTSLETKSKTKEKVKEVVEDDEEEEEEEIKPKKTIIKKTVVEDPEEDEDEDDEEEEEVKAETKPLSKIEELRAKLAANKKK